MTDELKRLNKYISESGICSRREADKLIEQGRVKLNGQATLPGSKVAEGDIVTVDDRQVAAKKPPVYLAYHKPVGITCTTERQVPGNIIDAIGYSERIFPIGRLDKPSEGLILLTNDGDIVNKILRAGNQHEKEYLVTVNKPINDKFLRQMATGVPILDIVTKPCQVKQNSALVFNIVLTQGVNQQIRRMCEYLGYEVTGLKRIRIMNISLQGLSKGHWRALTAVEIDHIQQLTEQSDKTELASTSDNQVPKRRAEKHRGVDSAKRMALGQGKSSHGAIAKKPGVKQPVSNGGAAKHSPLKNNSTKNGPANPRVTR